MLKLYTSPGSCALATHITLEETGAPFQLARVNFAANAQRSPEYLAVNPKGRVPALVTEHGILTETPALLLYLAQRYPERHLAPLEDPFVLAQMQGFNSYLCSTVHVAHAHGGRAARWSDDPAAHESMKAKVGQNMRDCFGLIERDYLRGPWVVGAAFTVADPYLFTMAGWLERDGVDIEEFPRVSAHRAAMLARPAVQRALAALETL